MIYLRVTTVFFLFSVFSINSYGQTDSTAKKASSSIQHSIVYMSKAMPIKSQNNLLLLEYLQRAYNLKYVSDIRQQLNASPQYDDEKEQMRFFRKLYGAKGGFAKQDLLKLSGIFRLMALSINTDVIAPDKELNDLIWSLSMNEDRDLTHAALCLAWLREQGKDGLLKEVDSLYKFQTAKLKSLAETQDYSTDTGLEALAGLIRLGKADAIQPEWIEKIVAAQNADGGWAWIPGDKASSNEHSTILAVWVLTHYLHHGKVNDKWIN